MRGELSGMRDFVEKRERLTDPYITAGNRVYIIGTQDGDFPDLGDHIPGEMAGVWDHPIKLFDGFYVGIATPMGTIWPVVTAYRAYPFYTEHVSRAADYELIRRQFVPDHEEAAVITMTYTPLSPTDEHRNLVFAVKSDLRPAWLSEDEDGRDTVDQHDGHLVFHDSLHPWTAMVGTSASTYAIHLGMNCACLTQGQGTASCISIPLVCEPGQSLTVHMVLAGSVNGLEACQATLERVLTRIDELVNTKATRYEVMDRYTAVSVPEAIASALRWVKYSTDWLVRTTDMGNGLGAGLPEYPWWFSCHAALSQLRVGDNLLDFEYRRVNEDELITVHSALDWTIHFVCPVKPFSELDGESDAVRAYRLSAGNQVTFRLVNTVDECVFEK